MIEFIKKQSELITKQSSVKVVKIIAIVLAVCAMAVAEDTTNIVSQKEVMTPLDVKMQKEISIDFKETSIGDVITIIADQADVDIIMSPEVMGNVTAKLTNVPLSEALTNLLSAHGYGYIKSQNMIRVMPLSQMTTLAERLVDRVYRITYADVKDVEKALAQFLSDRGSISSNPGTGNIIITDTESKIKAIDTFIEEIDRITPQILVEVRIYDVSYSDNFDWRTAWNVGFNNLTDSGQNSDGGNDGTDEIDRTGGGISQSDPDNSVTRVKNKPFAASSFDMVNGGAFRIGILTDAIDIDIALSMLQKQISAKLLANPRLLVLDNNTANFEIVREIPYTEVNNTSAGGAMSNTVFKNVGVKLQVTPHVTKDDLIKLHVMPEFGVVSGTYAVGAAPTVDTRAIDTTALVRNNQTIVIGGLRKREATTTINRTPFFSDIPLIGGLFKSEDDDVLTNELLVFITPKIIVEPTLSPDEMRLLEETDVPSVKTAQAEKGYIED
jgi:type IV pilus assembly protein PilQ